MKHLSLNTGYFEWYTPVWLLDMVRNVMGVIDLDPASCEIAQKDVRALKYHTRLDDGLLQKWEGSVFMNPPYTDNLIMPFIHRLVTVEYVRPVESMIKQVSTTGKTTPQKVAGYTFGIIPEMLNKEYSEEE